jgi:hypothetical protein
MKESTKNIYISGTTTAGCRTISKQGNGVVIKIADQDFVYR